ncbi:uncharacterized protein LOC135373882 [Ornithodoros turicata]|uniref:uncharacterized protein LOC135373882 n=1 Tax=Ornithodoros turicata TaxID=34597 RepID=UPI003138D122
MGPGVPASHCTLGCSVYHVTAHLTPGACAGQLPKQMTGGVRDCSSDAQVAFLPFLRCGRRGRVASISLASFVAFARLFLAPVVSRSVVALVPWTAVNVFLCPTSVAWGCFYVCTLEDRSRSLAISWIKAKCTRDPTSTFQDTFDVFIAVNNAVGTAHSRRGKITEMLKDIRLGIRFTRATSLCAPRQHKRLRLCHYVWKRRSG